MFVIPDPDFDSAHALAFFLELVPGVLLPVSLVRALVLLLVTSLEFPWYFFLILILYLISTMAFL